MNYTETILMKIQQDNTITIGNGVTDCNKMVCPESIALRELIIYSNLTEQTKKHIQSILIAYGEMFDINNTKEKLYSIKTDIQKLIEYDFNNISDNNAIQIMENIIIPILLNKYYQDFKIPTHQYDEIVYQHNNNFHITVTYKDIKTIVLQARDSGGYLDCFGYAHDGTTMNCVTSFVGDKLHLKYDGYFNFINLNEKETKEINEICEDLWCISCAYMNDFRIELY